MHWLMVNNITIIVTMLLTIIFYGNIYRVVRFFGMFTNF